MLVLLMVPSQTIGRQLAYIQLKWRMFEVEFWQGNYDPSFVANDHSFLKMMEASHKNRSIS